MTNTATTPLLRVFSIRDFRLLWFAGFVSVLGAQFSVIALPWLVLKLTDDSLALGMVLALAGIPQTVFMLIGGAIVDRFSPRTVLIVCDSTSFLMTGLSAALVFTGLMQVWMLYFFSMIGGLVSGFVIPAANSMVPSLVSEEDLQVGNSITMGSSQLAGFVGPALAGVVIGAYSQSMFGIAVAFAIDALTYALSAIALSTMSGRRKQAKDTKQQEALWRSLQSAGGYLWKHASLRFILITIAVANFLITGPLLVGIPVLADQHLAEGARAFGFLIAGYAGGNLVGYVLAGLLPKPSSRSLSAFLVALLVTFGIVLASFGWITQTWIDFALMLLLGTGNGYILLTLISWIQQRTPDEMLGRTMGILMLASMGLVPLSQALSGIVSRWNLTGLFALSGGLILLLTLWVASQPTLKLLSAEMTGDQRPQVHEPRTT